MKAVGSKQRAEKAPVRGEPTRQFGLTMNELAFKALDLILGGLLAKRRKKKALSEQLETLKRHVIHENVVNYLIEPQE